MARDLASPVDPRLLHRHLRIQPLGDRVADQGRAFLLEQLDEPLLLGDEGVDLGGFAIENGGDFVLLLDWRNRNRDGMQVVSIDTGNGRLGRDCSRNRSASDMEHVTKVTWDVAMKIDAVEEVFSGQESVSIK